MSQHIPSISNFSLSDPNKYSVENLRSEEMIISLGPQHPSTHGVLRLEVVSDGEVVVDVVPHLGFLHRILWLSVPMGWILVHTLLFCG